jgi:peptide/nickel transport system substrate-binding protein
MKLTRRAATVVLAGSVMVGMAGCAKSDRTTDSNTASGSTSAGSGGGTASDTFTFGAAGAPEVFDPYYASDGETFRITRQIFQGLLGIKPGTADPSPSSPRAGSRQGRSVLDLQAAPGREVHRRRDLQRRGRLLQLRAHVRPERGRGRRPGRILGLHDARLQGRRDESLYKSCEAKDDSTAVINLTRYTSDFPSC